MSGREVNGWGDCVWCGEMLTPEDPDRWSDRCVFCEAWNKVAQIAIDRRFKAQKTLNKLDPADKNIDFEKSKAYWTKQVETYAEIHRTMIQVMRLKKTLGD